LELDVSDDQATKCPVQSGGIGLVGVTPKLWEMSDMVKVLEDWESKGVMINRDEDGRSYGVVL
jgi:hypothetical protein